MPDTLTAVVLLGVMAQSRVGNPYFFTGRELDLFDFSDANTPQHFTDDAYRLQLYNYRTRTMDPVLGRFGHRDPIGGAEELGFVYDVHDQYRDGINPYEYVRSNPFSAVDPSGLCCCFDPGKVDDGSCRQFAVGSTLICRMRVYDWRGHLMSTTTERVPDPSGFPYSDCARCTKKCFPIWLPLIDLGIPNVPGSFRVPGVLLGSYVVYDRCRANGSITFWLTCCKDKTK